MAPNFITRLVVNTNDQCWSLVFNQNADAVVQTQKDVVCDDTIMFLLQSE